MPLNPSAWAIDGAATGAVLARVASYAETGGAEGVVSPGDLKVTQLDVAGSGVKIAGGAGLVLNGYQTTPNQTLTVYDEGGSTLDSTFMPPVNAGAQSHLVCVTVGVPGFSQSGHPWMTSDMPALGEEETFQYVRYFVIPNVPATTTDFSQLGLHYPALALARIDLPAGVTTVTTARIVDLRKLARPRSQEEIFNAASSSANTLNGSPINTYENWPTSASFSVAVPKWATKAKIFAYVEGARQIKAGNGSLRVTIVGVGSTTVTDINESDPAGTAADRRGYNVGGSIDIPLASRGTTKTIKMEGAVKDSGSAAFLSTDVYTSSMIRVRFEESAA